MANYPEMAYGYGVPVITSVVADEFCVPYPVELVIRKKHHGLFKVRYQVLDVNGNLFFQVDGSYINALHRKRTMRDSAGFPILTMREKAIIRQQWTVHRGESSDTSSEPLFTARQSYCLDMKTRIDVFLPCNISEDISNFQVVGSYPFESSRVYKGDTIIAEVNYNLLRKSLWKGKKREDFRVKVYPGVDYAFIVALAIILLESNMMLCAV